MGVGIHCQDHTRFGRPPRPDIIQVQMKRVAIDFKHCSVFFYGLEEQFPIQLNTIIGGEFPSAGMADDVHPRIADSWKQAELDFSYPRVYKNCICIIK